MEEIIKKHIGKPALIALFVFAISYAGSIISGIVYNFQTLKNNYPNQTIDIIGEGKVAAVPDVARFSLSVITEGGKNVGELQKENVEKGNQIINFLKTSGVESKDIQTQSYNVEPRYQNFSCPEKDGPCPPPEIIGYTIRQEVLVKVRDLNKVGDLLSGAIDKGANFVSQLSFMVDDPTKLQNQARQEAIAKAKESAQVLANAGGFKLKRLFRIYENPTGISYLSDYGGKGGGGGESLTAISPTIESGSQEIVVQVTLTYEIE